ncbi:DDE-type integrase/transposase/recombinase [Deinococcus sp. HMF7620]|uniref:DDE-type integrase/transposase/recombinase n=1 Tax=Deinococcus arboris TaxID=2682977 RepID=A0A7C9MAS7_9DEIO|nr:DDE-type integrase/transposase/recombinase [Deinococcus arboris]
MWRAVDEDGAVLNILLQEHQDTRAAKSFFIRLLGKYNALEVIHTDKLQSYGVAIRALPVLHPVEDSQVVSTARCNTPLTDTDLPHFPPRS